MNAYFYVILTYSFPINQKPLARYKTVPHSMWITLLNLSGEIPLAHYSPIGKVLIGIIGLFATAIFGMSIF